MGRARPPDNSAPARGHGRKRADLGDDEPEPAGPPNRRPLPRYPSLATSAGRRVAGAGVGAGSGIAPRAWS
ncbi:hypothetical protein SUDANB171_04097 [Streptomyces sp. enrichment culture]